MGGYRISELARLAGVPVDTVRHYERTGLIPPPPRSPAGYRLYPAETVVRLQMVRRARELGFSLSEIGELLDVFDNRGASCRHRHCRLVGKIEELDSRIAALHRLKSELQTLSQGCLPDTPIHRCPVLAAMVPAGGIAALLASVTQGS